MQTEIWDRGFGDRKFGIRDLGSGAVKLQITNHKSQITNHKSQILHIITEGYDVRVKSILQ
ncbi:Uncharacterized protein dnm_013890 [Desulfonema magnum]|uniref:Uncharacterized protein n=1 Tax=Desulfonema magnum TaxID=45655 RepID=A0A975BH76_9BACT|nr:Uncharacterized protein dnm_013890 [Desulfonema magnum]